MAKNAIWTVMVYLAGDNNLTAECLFALTEMKIADPGDRINVIAQFDPRDSLLPTRRYEINRTGTSSSLMEDTIDVAAYDRDAGEIRFLRESARATSVSQSRRGHKRTLRSGLPLTGLNSLLVEDEQIIDDTDTGSPITLYNFLSFCLEHYPAEHYMVVLSGHAGGTDSDYLLTDESPRGSLTFNELKEVFRQLQDDLGEKAIDIIGMDNCLMSMAEICYELRGTARVLVGSESYSPSGGWPYRQIIQRLKADVDRQQPHTESVAIRTGRAIVEEYVKYYSNYWMAGLSVSQSALNLQRVSLLREAIDSFGDTLHTELQKEYELIPKGGVKTISDALVLAHWEAQSYNGECYVDLYDFCDCLQKRVGDGVIKEQCEKVKRVISEEFVLKSAYWGASYQYSYGVSIYFPWSQVSTKYANLDFVKNSEGGWLRFLRTATTVTRRLPRGAEKLKNLRQSGELSTAESELTSDRMVADRIVADRMVADRMVADRMVADRMVADRMVADRMMGSGLGNPVQSMRNPPIVFILPELLEEHGN